MQMGVFVWVQEQLIVIFLPIVSIVAFLSFGDHGIFNGSMNSHFNTNMC
jgi:hypothetical protein